MEVIDNFLHKEIFDPMQVTMLGYAFPWFYNSDIVDENDKKSGRFFFGEKTTRSGELVHL